MNLALAFLIMIIVTVFMIIKRLELLDAIIIVILVAVFGLFISVIIGGTIVSDKTYDIKTEKSYDLLSLNDASSSSGSFFLGTGTINGTLTYYAYIKKEHDEIIPIVIPYNEIKIRFTDGTPTYKKIRYSLFKWCIGDKVDRIFYIPENSIKNNFILDGE